MPRFSTPSRAARWFFAVCSLSACALVLAASPAPQLGDPAPVPRPAPESLPPAPRAKTVIVVRHAEKDAAGDAQDPHLGEAGQRRAEALAALLRRSGASALLASEYHRTRDTLAPLATALGLTVESVPARDAAALVKRIDALPAGATVVVAGHSNTVPGILALLGAELPGVVEKGKPKNLPEDAFGRVFVVTLPPAAAREHVATTTLELSTDP